MHTGPKRQRRPGVPEAVERYVWEPERATRRSNSRENAPGETAHRHPREHEPVVRSSTGAEAHPELKLRLPVVPERGDGAEVEGDRPATLARFRRSDLQLVINRDHGLRDRGSARFDIEVTPPEPEGLAALTFLTSGQSPTWLTAYTACAFVNCSPLGEVNWSIRPCRENELMSR